jgi:glycosyltransferase involved in cell wall biosynthesis
MKILIYSHTNESTIKKNYGMAEYSYYLVLKEFLPVLKKLGKVIIIADPESEVDAIYKKHIFGDCVFLSFTPPHKTITTLQCPTIPVLAWEFEDIPTEIWDNDARNDWRFTLGKLGFAITHSTHTARAIRKAMRPDFPVTAIPAPVWDNFQGYYDHNINIKNNHLNINFTGTTIDTADSDWQLGISNPEKPFYQASVNTKISGTIYTTVLNPLDGRKNWEDIITAFCHALAEKPDATLILKFTNKSTNEWLDRLVEILLSLPKHQCRILMLNGFIDDESYANLARSTSYTVNASTGEGQCLPLMEYMSAGCPAISPKHTGMEDYINSSNAFIVSASLEPTPWPDDTRRLYRSYYHRVCWESLVNCFKESYDVVNNEPKRYRKMADTATNQLGKHCSRKAVRKKLKRFFTAHRNLRKMASKI